MLHITKNIMKNITFHPDVSPVYRTRSFTEMRCQNGETFNVHGETTSFYLQLCDAHTKSLILIMFLPDSLARLCLKRNHFNSDGKVTPHTFIFECTFESMAAMPALPSHLGSFFWLVNFRCFLRSEGPSLGATKGGMLWFNQARGLADRKVACAERVCTTASMDSQTLPPFFLLQRRLSKITLFDWSCLCAFGTAV